MTGIIKQEWRRRSKPQISILPDKGKNVLAMEVVEDFIYLNCSPSTSILQVIDIFSMYKAFVEIGEVKKHPSIVLSSR